MEEREKLRSEISHLHSKIKKLEENEIRLKKTEEKLKISNQQLAAGEQQLKAFNEQLKSSEQEIKAKEKQAQNAREFAENIIDTVRQPLLVLDKDLKIITANRYFYMLFQVSEKETAGNLLYELGNKQWNIPKLKELLKKTLPEKTSVDDYEVSHQFETIGKKTMLLNARELLQKEGKERFILLAIEDITSRKKAEREMVRLNTELGKKAAELQQILYITTHDLRSPLVNIQGFTKEMEASVKEMRAVLNKITLKEETANDLKKIMEEEIPEAIHFITSSTTKMDNLLKGLLTLSRLGRQKISFQELDMNRLIQEVIENYKFEIDNHEVEIEIGELPQCTGDELQINQLFSNLIGNSIKFLDPERKGKIKISGKKDKKGSIYIVEDNGIGISPDYTDKIFGLFEKLNPKKPGIGLGLNIVKQIVEKHNGIIQLESELGKRTKFTILIPVRRSRWV